MQIDLLSNQLISVYLLLCNWRVSRHFLTSLFIYVSWKAAWDTRKIFNLIFNIYFLSIWNYVFIVMEFGEYLAIHWIINYFSFFLCNFIQSWLASSVWFLWSSNLCSFDTYIISTATRFNIIPSSSIDQFRYNLL